MKYEYLNNLPDIHHTFYSIAAFSLSDPNLDLEKIEPLLAIDKPSFDSFFNEQL